MLILGIELLTGRYVAKQYDDHSTAEWPPHPARVYSALAAAYFEDAEQNEVPSKDRVALEWLEKQPAPCLYAGDAVRRSVLATYVPTNDKSVDQGVVRVVQQLIEAEQAGDSKKVQKERERLNTLSRRAGQPITAHNKELFKRALAVLPNAGERKQPRTFPSVYAYDPIVHVTWPEAEPADEVRASLEALAARVTRLGHSSSLVRLTWVQEHRTPTWIPDPSGPHLLRWVSEGQLKDLEAAFDLHRGTRNRVLPFRPERYRHIDDPMPAPALPRSKVFGTDWVVFELLGESRLPIVRAVDIAVALRGAALAHAGSAPPEALSGHGLAQTPSQRPHVAYLALPFVGFPHADGSVLGVAAVLPRDLVGDERKVVLRALGSIQRLTLPPGLAFAVRRLAEPRPHLRTLDPLLWCAEGVVWGTVTPILLDRFPGDLGSGNAGVARRAEEEAQEAIARACERIGLPRPRAVSLSAPCFRGSEAANRFRRRDRRGVPPRVRVHALIDFGAPVGGPVLLGAGRHVGLGLCRALD